MTIRERVVLAPLTTFKIGGEARYFVEVSSLHELSEAVRYAKTHTLPVFVLGGGSNILVSDQGFDGLVVHICITGIAFEQQSDRVLATVGAGESFDAFVARAVEEGYAGVECLSGIPGTVGGAVVANAGAYGQSCSDVFVSAVVFDTAEEKVTTIAKAECAFSYHASAFSTQPGRYIILQAIFTLQHTDHGSVQYADHRFNIDLGAHPSLARVRSAVLEVREKKGMLVMPGRAGYKGAGSFFRTLYVTEQQFNDLERRAQERNPDLEKRLRPWAWQQDDGSYKVAAGFLLEFTDFPKGYVRDTVGVSPQHQLSIISIENARAREVAALAHDMQAAVKNIFGIELEREVEYVGVHV